MILGQSLPPLVTGDLRGEIEVIITLVTLIDKSLSNVSVSPRWWGSKETDKEINEPRLYPRLSHENSPNASLAAALMEAESLAKTSITPSYPSIIYPVIADSDAITRYFADASTLTLIIRSENLNLMIGKASVLIRDSLGRGQTSLVGIANIGEESLRKGSLVYILRLRTGRESWLLSERSSLEPRIPSGEISSFTNTEDYLELLKRRKNVINRDGNVRIEDREQSQDQESRVNMKDEVKSVIDLDITYPLATTTSHDGNKSEIFPSTALEKCSTFPQIRSIVETIPNQDHISPVISPPNFQSLSMDFKKSDSSKLLHTSFEVAEDIASGDVHNLPPTPSSVFRKRTTTEEREKKARDLSGGLISRASRGTSPVTSSSSNLRGTFPPVQPLPNLDNVSFPNSSIGIVSFDSHKNGTQRNSVLASPFAATAPRPDGESEMIRALEMHKVLIGTDLWSAEYSSSANPSQREEQGNFVSSQLMKRYSQSEDVPSTCLNLESGQESTTRLSEDPSLWLAGISQPGFSRLPTELSHENVTANRTSNSSLTQLLSRSSATLKGIDEVLVICANLGGTGSLHARAMNDESTTSFGAILTSKPSKKSIFDIPVEIPVKIAKNLSQSEAIVAAYQDITSSLNKGGSSSTTVRNFFEKTTSLNSDFMSLPEGTDERTMAIINETASSSMGEITTSDDLTIRGNMHSSQRVNDPLSSVLQEANVEYSRLKSALSNAESALRLPSLYLLGDRLRSLSQRVKGINVDLSAAILFPAATVLSAYQSSGKFGPIALLAVEDEQGNLEKVKSESNQYPRILKQQSAQALKDWLKGCKVWLEYLIPTSATSDTIHYSQYYDEMCNEGPGLNEVSEPGQAITISVMAQPIGFSDHSHSSNVSSNDGYNVKNGEKIMSPTKSSSPTKPSAMTSALPRKTLAPPSESPLRLERKLLPENSSSQPSHKNTVTSTLSMNTAHLLLASIPHPSLSIPSGYVSDWDQQHSVMTLDSLAHTKENKIRFDDDGLSRWLGNADEGGLHQWRSLLDSDASSSIVVKLYLDASSHEQSLSPTSKLSSSETARSNKKQASLLQGGEDNALPSFASRSSASYPNSKRVVIGEGKVPLRQLLLSNSLSLDTTVDIFNVNYTPDKLPRVSSNEKTVAILKQVREKSSNTAIASFGSPVRDSTDVIKSRHETFLSSLFLSSDEKQRVKRALAVRTAAVENNPDETKRVVGEALYPIQRESLDGYLMTDSKVLRSDTMISSTPITSEVVARVRMRVCLLQNTLQHIEAEKSTSSINVVETLRSLPNEASEMKKSQSNLSEGYASLPRPPTYHSNLPPSSLHGVLGADWETLRLPASSFILQSTSDRGRDVNQKSKTSSPQSTSLFSNKASKLPHILLGDGNNRYDSIDAVEERGLSGEGASLILSLHKILSISPRGAFTALGGSSVADDYPHSNSSIVSLFVRAQPNRAIFSMPFDKPHIHVPSTRRCSHRVDVSPLSCLSSSLPEFRLNSDVILPLHKPSSTDDAEDLAKTLLSPNHSGCVLEVYGLIASLDESIESNVNSSSTNTKPRVCLISLEPTLLGSVKVPLEGVADALNLAARSETSLWDSPERVFRYPKVFDIIHPASADGSTCGQLSLTVYAAAHGRQVLVFIGQSAAAMEIQKWWSIVVVKARKNRDERERNKREEMEMEQLKAEDDERVNKVNGKGKGKKLQQRVSVNAKTLTSAKEGSLTKNTMAAPAIPVTTIKLDTRGSNHLLLHDALNLDHLQSRSSEPVPPTITSELVSSTINHAQKPFSQNSNPWIIVTNSDVISLNAIKETQDAHSLVDVESAPVVDDFVPDYFPLDHKSVDANHAIESGHEENVDTSTYFHTHSTEPKIGSSTSNMQGNDHESFKRISVEEAKVSITASDDSFIDDIATSPTIAITSRHPQTSNLIHSLNHENKLATGQLFEKICTIDTEASQRLNSIDSLDRDCEQNQEKTSETVRLSFISEVPRLRIDSLQNNLFESERMSEVLPSSLYCSQLAPIIDNGKVKMSIDDLLSQLAHEQIHKEKTVIEEKLKTNEIIDGKECAGLSLNSDKSSESELVNVEYCAKKFTSTIDTVSLSTNDCCNINSSDVGMEHPTESHSRLNSTVSETESQNEINFELQLLSIVFHPQSHPTVDIDIHRDDVHDAVDDFDHLSDSEMYSLNFESVTVTHSVDACEIDEDGHSQIQSDGKVDEDFKDDNCMDYDNSSIENGGEVIHSDDDHGDANKIPGYVFSMDEETREEVIESEEPAIVHEPLSKNSTVITKSKRFSNGHCQDGGSEDDYFNIDEHLDIEDDGEDNQRKLSSLILKKNYFQYRLSEHLDNVDVDEDGQEKNSDFLLSKSGSPISMLELLSYQDELFFKAVYNDDINKVYDEAIYDDESNEVSTLPVITEQQSGVIGMVGDYVSTNLDQFPPSLTIEQCNSITFSEIEEALALEETSRAQSINNCVAFEEVDIEQPMIQTSQNTVSKLLGSTFKEELLSAVSVERGHAFAEKKIEVNDRIDSKTILMSSSLSFSPSNHVSSYVAGCDDLVAVIDQWVESQRSTLIANIDASIDKDNVSNSPISSNSAEHMEEVKQSGSVMTTDDTNTQRAVTLHVTDRDRYCQDQRYECPQTGQHSLLTNSDCIVQLGSLHISENFPVSYNNHTRLREMLGLPSSSTLTSTPPQHSNFMNKASASQSQTLYRDVYVEKRRTPTRLIDVRDTNKLAELLRGVKSRRLNGELV